MTPRWQIVRDAAPALRKWGDQYVVHHALSNDTHRLSSDAGRILTELIVAGEQSADGIFSPCATESAESQACLPALAVLGLVTEC